MKKYLKNKNTWFVVGGISIAVLIGVALKRKRVVVGKTDQDEPPRPNFNPAFFATKVKNSIDGWAYNLGEKKEVYNDLLRLNNSELIEVYNYFNKNYGKGETMRQKMLDEWINDQQLKQLEQQLETRFNLLELP